MSEIYGTLGATVPKSTDYASGGADVPKAFRDFTDSIGAGQTAGKILVVPKTGAAVWTALKGDATLAADGTLTIAKDGETATPSLRTLGTGAKQAAAGNDGRLSDERVPLDKSVTSPKWSPTVGVHQVEGTAEESVSSVEARKVGGALVLAPSIASRLFCSITAFWWQEGGEAKIKAGVKVGSTNFLSSTFDSHVAGTGWRTATFHVIANVPASEKEIFMVFQPGIVGGGNTYKVIPANWSMLWMLGI